MIPTLPDWLVDIGALLQTSGIGTVGTDIFYEDFEPSVQNCIALSDQAGNYTIVSLSGNMALYRPELGIRIRNQSVKITKLKANSIYQLLNLKTNFISGSTHFKRMEAISPPFFVSHDSTEGTIFSINFSLEISGV